MQRNLNIVKITIASFLLCFAWACQAANLGSLFRQGSDPIGGNPRGDITVVEFFDYECPHCANEVSNINGIVAANPNVRIVYKDLPILSQTSVLAARAALAAKKQGQYIQFYTALFENTGAITEATIFNIAKNLRLNMKQFEKDLKSDSITAQLKANIALADQLNIYGTPAFYVGRTNETNMDKVEILSGEVSQSTIQKAIDGFKG